MRLRTILEGWNQFWFVPQSPLPIAIFRILVGVSLLQYAILLVPEMSVWFGEEGLLSSETARQLNPGPHINILQYFSTDEFSLCFLFCVLVLAATTITVGFFTRFSCPD